MGCCNKKHSGKPISKARYYGGLIALGSAQGVALGALYALSVPFPRYRKVIPFFRAYAKETVMSVIDKDRITIEGEEPVEEACLWEPDFGVAGAVEPLAAFADAGSFTGSVWEPAV